MRLKTFGELAHLVRRVLAGGLLAPTRPQLSPWACLPYLELQGAPAGHLLGIAMLKSFQTRLLFLENLYQSYAGWKRTETQVQCGILQQKKMSC